MYRQVSLVAVLAIVAGMTIGSAAIRTNGYHNIHIAAVDPQAAVDWYVEYLGAEAVNAPATHVMLGGTLVAFQQAEAKQPSVAALSITTASRSPTSKLRCKSWRAQEQRS